MTKKTLNELVVDLTSRVVETKQQSIEDVKVCLPKAVYLGKETFELMKKLGIDYWKKAADKLPEPQRTEELILIFTNYKKAKIKQNQFDEEIQEVAKPLFVLKKIKVLSEMYKKFIEYKDIGYLANEEDIAKTFPEPQRTRELTLILKKYIENGWLDNAEDIADFLLSQIDK